MRKKKRKQKQKKKSEKQYQNVWAELIEKTVRLG